MSVDRNYVFFGVLCIWKSKVARKDTIKRRGNIPTFNLFNNNYYDISISRGASKKKYYF